MEELQQQIVTWCLALKDYLKCEQCQGQLSPDIYLCEAGHLVCSSCLQKSANNLCSLCKLPYTRTRNYLAENLAQKMDNILQKIDVNHADEAEELQSVCSESNTSWNIFPCWVGRCKFRGPPEEIRQHCRDNHPGLFETIIDKQLPVSRSWNFDYSFPRTLNRLFDITDLGIFLLHIIIYDNGALRAYIFMYDSGRTARDYKYQLKIDCSGENLTFEGEVDCARIPRSQLAKKGLFIPRAQNLQVQLQNVQKFKVTVEISKNPKNRENSSEKLEKKNQYKNRRSKPSKPKAGDQELSTDLSGKNSENNPKAPEDSQQKKPNKSHENRENSKKNQQKKSDSDVRNNNHKGCIEKKSQDFHKNQSKVNNCLQTTDPIPRFNSQANKSSMLASPPQMFAASPPPLFPGASSQHHPTFNAASGHPSPNYPPPNFYQGPNHGPFNPHVPPTIPAQSANYYKNVPPPSTYNGQPSAPTEDHFGPLQYPDLTPMKQGMTNDRLEELVQKINERERARLSGDLGNDSPRSKRDAKSKDKCCVS